MFVQNICLFLLHLTPHQSDPDTDPDPECVAFCVKALPLVLLYRQERDQVLK